MPLNVAMSLSRATSGLPRSGFVQTGILRNTLSVSVPGVDPWDALELDAWLARGAATDAELATAAFVLRVWNAGDPWSRPFDAMEAMARWDHVNRAVFVEWARAPWRP